MNELWCVHIPGPDEYWAVAGREDGRRLADEHNRCIGERYVADECMPLLENLMARVVPWPFDPERHAESLKRQE